MEGKSKKISSSVILLASLAIGFVIWTIISLVPSIGSIIVGPAKVFEALISEYENGNLAKNISISLWRVFSGFSIGLITAIPVAFLMGWYTLVRQFVEPWIQFFRTIPPIALIPLVIVALGVGESAKTTVIFVASFLVMVVTIYQGVKGVDPVLINAARVLGASDRDIFFDVVVPASVPYILVGVRLGLGSALTTLVAAELTGASNGLGNMIMEASLYFRMDVVMLGIILIGVIGFILDKAVLYLEKRITSWQEMREQ